MLFRRTIDPSTTSDLWVARVLAVGLTLVLFLSIGWSAGRVRSGDFLLPIMPRYEPVRPERIVFQTLPSPMPQARHATPPAAARSAPPRRSTQAPPAQPAATLPSRSRTVPDSGGSATAHQPPASTATGLAAPDARLAPPVTRFTPPLQSAAPSATSTAPPCTAPCVAGTRAGVTASQRALTAAERDSMLRAIAASIPLLAKRIRDSAARAGDCPGCAGIPAPPSPSGMPVPVTIGGISIPLPGGGPSRAQRKRDSTINAHTVPILERLKQRADSVRAARRRDSLEATAKRRRDSLQAIEKPRRDSSTVKPRHDSSSTFPPPLATITCVLPRCRTQAVLLHSCWRSPAQPSSRFPGS